MSNNKTSWWRWWQRQQSSGASNVPMALLNTPRAPKWMELNYHHFVNEAYRRNVIVYRCVNLIAQGAASIDWLLFSREAKKLVEQDHHPWIELFNHPQPNHTGADFFTEIYTSLLLSGNAFLRVIKVNNKPRELYCLRPDRVMIVPGEGHLPTAYRFQIGNSVEEYPVDPVTGASDILHIKFYHPLDDYYGLSPLEAAARSIDQHNQAAIWNQSLLQNSARPSGALIVRGDHNSIGGQLTEEQFHRLKQQVSEEFSGPVNHGKPLLLEGGLEWQEMGLSNKDMDFIEAKHMSAREIALAFGVPPQLLGIPGDNTYSNLQEARLALWEETIFPLVDNIKKAMSRFFNFHYNTRFVLDYDKDKISALAFKRERLWAKLEAASFLTENEKREAVGYPSQ